MNVSLARFAPGNYRLPLPRDRLHRYNYFMPTYEYLCESNGRTVEVSHKMAEQLHTWGELCERAGISAGRTAPAAPVRKLISASAVHSGKGSSLASSCETTGACDMGAAMSGPCCGGGVCPH